MILSYNVSDEKIFLFFSLLGNSINELVLLSGPWRMAHCWGGHKDGRYNETQECERAKGCLLPVE
jgi:hypothetical protein